MLPEGLIPVTTTCGPAPRAVGDPLGPAGYGYAGSGAGLVHAVLQLWSVVEVRGRGGLRGALARDLDVDDLVLRRAAGRGDRDLLADPFLRTARPTGEAWESLPLPGSDSLAPDDLEGPLLAPVHDP